MSHPRSGWDTRGAEGSRLLPQPLISLLPPRSTSTFRACSRAWNALGLTINVCPLYSLSMAPYLFPYPTTGSVTFANVFIDRWQDYGTELAEATIARTRFQLALKAAAGNEPGSSALAVLEVGSLVIMLTSGRTSISTLPSGHHCMRGDRRLAVQRRA